MNGRNVTARCGRLGTITVAAGLAAALALPQPAFAFFHAGGWGGAAGGHWGAAGDGHWAAGGDGHGTYGTYGTSASGEHYATSARGGSATAQNGSWSATTANGRTDSGSYGTTANGTHYATGNNGAVAVNDGHYAATGPNGYAYGNRYVAGGGTWNAVHSPTVVNQYNTGCYDCGGWSSAGAAVAAGVTGLAVGTAIGATAAANAAVAARPYSAPYVMGDVYAALPVGCAYSPYGGAAYYNCGGVWFSPYYGANGMYYRVVPVP
jgi:hypothetical protein